MRKEANIVACAAILLIAVSANAVVPILSTSGELLGATDVEVLGSFYDVEFLDGSCVSLFDGCDANSDFTFRSNSAATAAAYALLEQVLLNGPFGNFDSVPTLTNGCDAAGGCILFIPFQASPYIAIAAFSDDVISNGGGGDVVLGEFGESRATLTKDTDTHFVAVMAYTRWSLAGAKPPVEIIVSGGSPQECRSEGGSDIDLSAVLGITPDPVISIEWLLNGDSVAFGSDVTFFVPLGQQQIMAVATTDVGDTFSDDTVIEVVDTTAPDVNVVLRDRFGNPIAGIRAGLNQIVVDGTASDICDPAPIVTAEGTIPLHEGGILRIQPAIDRILTESDAITVKVMAVDASGNESEAEITLTIP